MTPCGIWILRSVIGEPSQPCSTLNATVPEVPASIANGSGSTWAEAIPPATRTTTADAAAETRTCLKKAVLIIVHVAR